MQRQQTLAAEMIVSVPFGGIVLLILYLYDSLVLKPKRLSSNLEMQGIRGPLLSSNLFRSILDMKRIKLEEMRNKSKDIPHDWPSIIVPHLLKWRTEYGPNFTYSIGGIQILGVKDIETVKEIRLIKSLSFGRPSYLMKDYKPLFGKRIASCNGAIWSHQRKIIAPEFYLDKDKRSSESKIESEGGIAVITVDEDLRSLAADIISKASFGSNYSEGKGKEIFLKLRTLQQSIGKGNIGVPGVRYLPMKRNREIRRSEKEIHSMILGDLLQMILEGAKSCGDADSILSAGMSHDQFMVDNCKAIYFAAHETKAIAGTWSLMLLVAYPEWQARARARAEVHEICRNGVLDADMLQDMKTLTTVIKEALRMYRSTMFVSRQALEDIKLKDIVIPKGMNIQIPIPVLHHPPDIWGPDALDFNPKRFEHGILKAFKFPQNLAMAELKVTLSLILFKFSFSLSPAYCHCIDFGVVVEPVLLKLSCIFHEMKPLHELNIHGKEESEETDFNQSP
ncbi:cytochrome P450 714C2-like [Pyrus ussuriensis x Pyrus communis]|uniref:Cytochrome P450 714C2-like n=1 Tax=Pyrus ussuriensis x Pyrus communis TaxID=2448454 RepID=A0A5N5G900_9ROSA|nr:cytochrome P450 714C2-like [Pyrus ussuriensis x Pyrus communis]